MSQHLSEVTLRVGDRQDQYVTLSVTLLDDMQALKFDSGELRFVPNKERGADVLVWRNRGQRGQRGQRWTRFVHDKDLRVLCRRKVNGAPVEVFWL